MEPTPRSVFGIAVYTDRFNILSVRSSDPKMCTGLTGQAAVPVCLNIHCAASVKQNALLHTKVPAITKSKFIIHEFTGCSPCRRGRWTGRALLY